MRVNHSVREQNFQKDSAHLPARFHNILSGYRPTEGYRSLVILR